MLEFLSQMKIPNLRCSLCQGWGDLWFYQWRIKVGADWATARVLKHL